MYTTSVSEHTYEFVMHTHLTYLLPHHIPPYVTTTELLPLHNP